MFLRDTTTGPLGPLWEARADAEGVTMDALVRVVTLPHGLPPEDQTTLTEAAWDSTELCHDGVLGVADVIFGKQWLALVHDYTEGTVLRSLLLRAVEHSSVFDPAVAVRMALDIVSSRTVSQALSQGAGVTWRHGGISAASAMLCGDGFVRLLDGCVPAAAVRIGSLRTAPGALAYAAPEQMSRESDADARTDVFALGILVWELLSGQQLLSGSQAAVAKHLAEPIPPLATDGSTGVRVSSELAAVVARALELDPAKRFATLNEFGAALKQASAGEIANRGEVIEFIDALLHRESTLFRLLADPSPRLTERIKSMRPPKRDLAAAEKLAAQAKAISETVDRVAPSASGQSDASPATATSEAVDAASEARQTPSTPPPSDVTGGGSGIADGQAGEAPPPRPQMKTLIGLHASGFAGLSAETPFQSAFEGEQADEESQASALARNFPGIRQTQQQGVRVSAGKQAAAGDAQATPKPALAAQGAVRSATEHGTGDALVHALRAQVDSSLNAEDTQPGLGFPASCEAVPPSQPDGAPSSSGAGAGDASAAPGVTASTGLKGGAAQERSAKSNGATPTGARPREMSVRDGQPATTAQSASLKKTPAEAAKVPTQVGAQGKIVAKDAPRAQSQGVATDAAKKPAMDGAQPTQGAAADLGKKSPTDGSNAAAPVAAGNGAKKPGAETQKGAAQAGEAGKRTPSEAPKAGDATQATAPRPSERPKALAEAIRAGAAKTSDAAAPGTAVAGGAARSPDGVKQADATRAGSQSAEAASDASGVAKAKLVRPPDTSTAATRPSTRPFAIAPPGGGTPAQAAPNQAQTTPAGAVAASGPRPVSGGAVPGSLRSTVLGLGGASVPRPTASKPPPANPEPAAGAATTSDGETATTAAPAPEPMAAGEGAPTTKPDAQASAQTDRSGPVAEQPETPAKPESETADGSRATPDAGMRSAVAVAEDTTAAAPEGEAGQHVSSPGAKEPESEQRPPELAAEGASRTAPAEPQPAQAAGQGTDADSGGASSTLESVVAERSEPRAARKAASSAFEEFLESEPRAPRDKGSLSRGGNVSSALPSEEASRSGLGGAAAQVNVAPQTKPQASTVAELLSEAIDKAGAPETTAAEPVTNLLDGGLGTGRGAPQTAVSGRPAEASASMSGTTEPHPKAPQTVRADAGTVPTVGLGGGVLPGQEPAIPLAEFASPAESAASDSAAANAGPARPQSAETQVRAIVVASQAATLTELEIELEALRRKSSRRSRMAVFFGVTTLALAGVVFWLLQSKPEPVVVAEEPTRATQAAPEATPTMAPASTATEAAPVASAPAPTEAQDAGSVADAGASVADDGGAAAREADERAVATQPTQNEPTEKPPAVAAAPAKRARAAAATRSTRPKQPSATPAKARTPAKQPAPPAKKKKGSYVPDDL